MHNVPDEILHVFWWGKAELVKILHVIRCAILSAPLLLSQGLFKFNSGEVSLIGPLSPFSILDAIGITDQIGLAC